MVRLCQILVLASLLFLYQNCELVPPEDTQALLPGENIIGSIKDYDTFVFGYDDKSTAPYDGSIICSETADPNSSYFEQKSINLRWNFVSGAVSAQRVVTTIINHDQPRSDAQLINNFHLPDNLEAKIEALRNSNICHYQNQDLVCTAQLQSPYAALESSTNIESSKRFKFGLECNEIYFCDRLQDQIFRELIEDLKNAAQNYCDF